MVVYYCMSHGSTGVDIIKEDNRAPVSSKELSSFERDKIIEKKKKTLATHLSTTSTF